MVALCASDFACLFCSIHGYTAWLFVVVQLSSSEALADSGSSEILCRIWNN